MTREPISWKHWHVFPGKLFVVLTKPDGVVAEYNLTKDQMLSLATDLLRQVAKETQAGDKQ